MTSGAVAVARDALDPRLEIPARHVDGAGDMTLFPLVALAHVDEQRVVHLARLARVDLGDLVLGLLEEFPVTEHDFTNDSNVPGSAFRLPWRRTCRRRLRSRSSSPSWPCRRRLGRRRHARDAADARAAEGRSRASRRSADDLPTPAAAQIRAAYRNVAAREHRHDGAASATSTRSDPVVQLYRGIALYLGRLHRTTPRTCCGEAKKVGARHAVGAPGRQPAPSRSTRSATRRSGRSRPNAPARDRARACRARATSTRRARLRAAAQADAPGTTRGAGRRRGRALRQGQPERVVLATRPADAQVPEEPVGAVLPRAAARVDGPAGRGDRAVPQDGRARARSTELGRGAAQFLSESRRDRPGGTSSSTK